MMGTTESLVMLKTHIDSINIRFVNDFVYVNMLWAFGSLRVFICNYVLYSLGLILGYFFRFLKVGDAENELPKHPPQIDGIERNHFSDSEICGFREELANFLFWSGDDDVLEGSGEREGVTECSVFMDSVSDFPEDDEKLDGEKECFVFKEIHSDIIQEDNEKTEVHAKYSVLKENIDEDVKESSGEDESVIHEDTEKSEVHTEYSVLKENIHEDGKESPEEDGFAIHEDGNKSGVETEGFDVHQDGKKIDEDETERSVCMENGSSVQHDSMNREEEKETGEPVFVESHSDVHQDSEKLQQSETESSVFKQSSPAVKEDMEMDKVEEEVEEEEEEEEGPVFMDTDTATTTNKCQYLSGKDVISGFIEEPTTMSFSFREFYMGPDVSEVSNNACPSTVIIADKVFQELDTEDPVAVEGKDNFVQFESELFGGTESYSSDDEDHFLFNENSLESDSESESSTSSGLIWGNSNKIDDSIAYQFLASNEGFETEILKLMMKGERSEVLEEKQFSCGGKVSDEDGYVKMEADMKDLKPLNVHGFGVKDQNQGSQHEEEALKNRWEEELCESESDEEDLEWEHDDLVEQLKMELKNARQGGLATILEEEEDDMEAESPKMVEDLKPLKIEEKLEYKDQIDEIENVYKSYAEKMRKLDILNYQTMHALGLVQLKDPLKLISIPKSSIQLGAKPVISQNLWPRKASNNTSDPLLKIVHELHRDLELVYVGQVCLSWEILCWQHEKAQELQQLYSQGSRKYNHVAGEFQLFQVLIQRFIENEPFQQGTRIQTYVKNRCVIRNLLLVPAIKDDSMKDKNITKGDEEDAITSGRLADIIKESMRVFWEFVRADKDYGNVILKAFQQIGTDFKDPAISSLLVDIRTQLQKKEKKLKDIVRSGNCIVKKFQKHHEDQLDHEQLVAQVGLRLISRVLHLSKLRKEQLIWCHEKLHRIKFLSRKIVQVEPSFVLFPC